MAPLDGLEDLYLQGSVWIPQARARAPLPRLPPAPRTYNVGQTDRRDSGGSGSYFRTSKPSARARMFEDPSPEQITS